MEFFFKLDFSMLKKLRIKNEVLMSQIEARLSIRDIKDKQSINQVNSLYKAIDYIYLTLAPNYVASTRWPLLDGLASGGSGNTASIFVSV